MKFKIKVKTLTTAAGDDVTVKLDADTKNKIDNAANKDFEQLTPAGEQEVKIWLLIVIIAKLLKSKGGDAVKFIDVDNVEIIKQVKIYNLTKKRCQHSIM